MPTYEYACKPCGHRFDVIKPMARYDWPEACAKCGLEAERLISATSIDSTAGDWNRIEFNPALGQWTKGWGQARKIAKARGMEEVGNEPVENLHKAAERQRVETREKRWRDADRNMLYD